MGLLELGMRTQVSPWSTPLIQRSWKVAWEATWVAERAAARAKMVDFMDAVDGGSLSGGGREGKGLAQADSGFFLILWVFCWIERLLLRRLWTIPLIPTSSVEEKSQFGSWVDATAPKTCYEAAMLLLACKQRSCAAGEPSDGSHLTSIDGRLVNNRLEELV